MADPTDEELERLAGGVGLKSSEFGAIYDELSPAGERKWQVLRLMRDPAKPVFFSGLRNARDGGWLTELTDRILEVDGFKEIDEDTDSAEALRTQLQSILDPALGFLGAENLRSGTVVAVRRVCKIEVQLEDGDLAWGTGFLIGPQAVLTNWHVVAPVMKGEKSPPAGSEKKLRLIFDYHRMRGEEKCDLASGWLIGASETHPSERPTEAVFDEAADPLGFDSHLDFAVLRPARPVGRERGYYSLDPELKPCLKVPGSQLVLFQHPGGSTMRVAVGAGTALWPDGVGTRLRHTANSTPGSSGGLLLNSSFKPVALHQCGLKDAGGNAVVNGAIPTASIAAMQVNVQSVVGTDYLWRTKDGEAILGRDDFQDRVAQAADGAVRIITVRGGEKSGKTFSMAILQSILEPAEHVVVALPASTVPAEARDCAVEILRRIAPAGTDPPELPDIDERETAKSAWIRDLLAPALMAELRKAAGQRVIWLVLDDLDKEGGIPDTSVRQLLEQLYRAIGSAEFLRIILLGFTGAVPGADPELVADDDARPLHGTDLVAFFKRRFTAEDSEFDDNAVTALAATGMGIVDKAKPLTPQLGNYASKATLVEGDG